MLIRNMPKYDFALGALKHREVGEFSVTVRFFETTAEYDYWIAVYDGEHSQWGHMRFQATIPKKLAPTVEFALALVKGAIADQVRSTLLGADADGRSLEVVFSGDGWTLV